MYGNKRKIRITTANCNDDQFRIWELCDDRHWYSDVGDALMPSFGRKRHDTLVIVRFREKITVARTIKINICSSVVYIVGRSDLEIK